MTLLASLTKFQGPLLIFKNLQDLSVVYFKERTARTFKTHTADFFVFFKDIKSDIYFYKKFFIRGPLGVYKKLF